MDFVARTGVDALAIAMAVPRRHKFSRKPDGDILAMHVIEAIHQKLPNTHLVMHGSSSVPQELQDLINRYGGRMPQTFGVPVDEIVRGIRHGVRKVNIDTDCRMAMAGQIRRVAAEDPSEFDPRKFMKPAMDALRDLCRDRSSSSAPPATLPGSRSCPWTRCAPLRQGTARPPDRQGPSGLINDPTTTNDAKETRNEHPVADDGRGQGALQVGCHSLQADGLLGAGLQAEAYRYRRHVPHHAPARRGS